MGIIPLRAWLYIGAFLALATAGGFVLHWKHKADKYDEAKQLLSDARKAYAIERADTAKKLAQSEAERKAYSLAAQAIAQRFNSIEVPSPRTLVRTVEVPNACPRVGVSDQFVGVYNAASSP